MNLSMTPNAHAQADAAQVDAAQSLAPVWLQHAVLAGTVGHQRYSPKPHGFDYNVHYFWLRLSALDALDSAGPVRREQFGAFSYRRADYLAGDADLRCAVLAKVNTLRAADMQLAAALAPEVADTDTEVFLLSPLANWGVFFSPLTLYFGYRDGQLVWQLAEVSNTPWNERHYYLVPLQGRTTSFSHAKNFHVSPFNPLDMQYLWHIQWTDAQLDVGITNLRAAQKVFAAWFSLSAQPLTHWSQRRLLIQHPWQNVQVVTRIYWHALKLLIKGMPIYDHPASKDANS